MRSLSPSCFSVRERAANRLSFSIRRCTNFLRKLRDIMKETVLPTTVALAAMNHLVEYQQSVMVSLDNLTYPLGNPYTKPAIVRRLEYPISGGNDTMMIANHSISQPAGISRHFFAYGSSEWKMLSL